MFLHVELDYLALMRENVSHAKFCKFVVIWEVTLFARQDVNDLSSPSTIA